MMWYRMWFHVAGRCRPYPSLKSLASTFRVTRSARILYSCYRNGSNYCPPGTSKASANLSYVETLDSVKRPPVNAKQAIVLSRRLFGLQVSDDSTVEELDSHEDRNFYMKGTLSDVRQKSSADEFLLKITNHASSAEEGLLDAQSSSMQFLVNCGFSCQLPIHSHFGGTEVMCKIPRDVSRANEVTTASDNYSPMETESNKHLIDGIELFNGEDYDSQKFFVCAVRLLTFIPGSVLCDVQWTEDLLYHVGRWIGEITLALQKFDHPAINGPSFQWDLSNTPIVESYIHAVSNNSHKELVLQVCKRFTEEVLPKLPNMNRRVIHGDLNELNIIVRNTRGVTGDRYDFGLIDFSELNKSYRVFDIAIALMYIMGVDKEIPFPRLEAAGHVLAGYHSIYPLTELEVDLLYVSVAARFCQSLVYGAYKYTYVDPSNEYLLRTAKKGWHVFPEFWETPKEEVLEIWNSVAFSWNTTLW